MTKQEVISKLNKHGQFFQLITDEAWYKKKNKLKTVYKIFLCEKEVRNGVGYTWHEAFDKVKKYIRKGKL